MSQLSITEDELVTLDDGFKYYWPEGCHGAFSSVNLRQIADTLDEMNKSWQDQLDKYMNDNP